MSNYVIRRRGLTWYVETEDATEVASTHDTRKAADEALEALMDVAMKVEGEAAPKVEDKGAADGA